MFLVWYPRVADVPRQVSLRWFPESSMLSYVINMFKYTYMCIIELLLFVLIYAK